MRVREITKPPHPTPRTCERSRGERCHRPRAPRESIPPPPQSGPFQLPNGGWWPYLDETSKLHSAAACCELFSPAHNSWYITCPWVWCVVYSCVEARDKSSSVPGDDVSTGYATSEMQQLFASENWKPPRISSERGFAFGWPETARRKDDACPLASQGQVVKLRITTLGDHRQRDEDNEVGDDDGNGDFPLAIPHLSTSRPQRDCDWRQAPRIRAMLPSNLEQEKGTSSVGSFPVADASIDSCLAERSNSSKPRPSSEPPARTPAEEE